MALTRQLRRVVAVLIGVSLCHPVFATYGYFPHGTGAKNKAMAGAGMAAPEDAISIVNNPAVAAFLDNRMDVGLSLFIPRRNYATFYGGNHGRHGTFSFGMQDIDSDNDLFFTPEIARTRQLANDAAFAWAFYMRSGIGTSYRGGTATFDPDGDGPLGVMTLPGTYGDGTAGLELSQGFIDITWAKRWGEKTSFGVSAVLAAQSLKVTGLGGLTKYTETFAVNDGAQQADKLSGNGRDVNYGLGLKVGLHRLLGQHFSFGVMYQSEINIGSSGDYADLLTGGGNLDIPAWFRMGLTWRPVSEFSFSIDVQHIWYSKIDALNNSFFKIHECPTSGAGGTDLNRCLGGRDGPGFGWGDVPVYSFGARWALNDKWTLRGGFGFGKQPTPASETTFNILMINVTETHYTAGVSRKLSNGHELSISFMYSEEESLKALNQLDPSQVIGLRSDQFDFQISYGWGD